MLAVFPVANGSGFVVGINGLVARLADIIWRITKYYVLD